VEVLFNGMAMALHPNSPAPQSDNRRVALIKSLATKNRFYALVTPESGIRNADTVEEIPQELLLGIAYPCLEDGLNDFAVIRTTYETLEFFPDDDEMRVELMEIVPVVGSGSGAGDWAGAASCAAGAAAGALRSAGTGFAGALGSSSPTSDFVSCSCSARAFFSLANSSAVHGSVAGPGLLDSTLSRYCSPVTAFRNNVSPTSCARTGACLVHSGGGAACVLPSV